MKNILHIQIGLLSFLFSLVWTSALSQEDLGIFELLAKDEIPELVLEADLSKILEDKTSDENFPAVISWETATGTEENWSLKLSIRGKFRRMKCDFPPLSMKFTKDHLAARGFNKHNKLKLVTHCLDERGEGQENLLKEYLAYQLYQELTPNAYRVQLVRIRYTDSSGKLGSFKRYAFLLEDTDDMAERIGGEECDHCMNPLPSTLDGPAENLHALFQFLIGNTDFSLPMVRNLKLVTLANGKLIPVGYDFDFSGFVNANYALPANELGQHHVRERIFLGMYSEDSTLRENLQLFVRKKASFLKTVDEFRLLNRLERDEILSYLEEFYTKIELVLAKDRGLYQGLRQSYPAAIPSGGMQEHYGESK